MIEVNHPIEDNHKYFLILLCNKASLFVFVMNESENNKIISNVLFGYGEVDITPSYPVELVGFDREDQQSRGVLDRLTAQILLFEDNRDEYVIIVIDSLGFTVALTSELRRIIAAEYSIKIENIMVCFTHCHSAPNAAREVKYYEFVCNRILHGISEACNSRIPVIAAWGCAGANIGINRRDKDGVVDKRVGVLKICSSATNKVIALLLRITAHANVLSSDNYCISSDFIGVTRKQIGNKYNCKVVITQGASGNVRPRFQHPKAVMDILSDPNLKKKLESESKQAMLNMANEIDKSIEQIVIDAVPEEIHNLKMLSSVKRFYADVPNMEAAQKIAVEAKKNADIDGSDWLSEVKALNERGIFRQHKDVEIMYFILNEGCICGVANEVMCEISLAIENELNDPLTFFGGYTNGCDGYLPTKEEYEKGGYEVLWSYLLYYKYHGTVMPLNPDSALLLVKEILSRRQSLSKQVAP